MQRQPDAREDVYFVLTSLAHVVATVLFGMLLNLSQFPGLLILAFAATSKAFALFAGENERFFAHVRWAAIPLAVLSVVILAFLPPIEWVLGACVMFLYLNYPLVIRARERAPLDILFHGSRYAALFWMGFGAAISPAAVAGASVVFISGVAGELLVGLRSEGRWKTTAAGFGVTSTVRIVNILVLLIFLLGSFIFSQVVNFPLMVGRTAVPVPLVAGLLIAIFISRPVSSGKSAYAPLSVRRREVLVIAVVALLVVGIPLVTRVNISAQTPSSNYTATITMQTLITGPKPQDGQWIVFNYHNASDYYYLFLHTNGYLEVSGYVNGTQMSRLAYVQTDLSPFNSHRYTIVVDDGRAAVSIDGRQYANVSVGDGGGEVRVTQYFPRLTFWVVQVTQVSVEGVDS